MLALYVTASIITCSEEASILNETPTGTGRNSNAGSKRLVTT